MEQLNRLIKDASNQFQCHNFQTSLSLYVRCIRKCQEQKFPQYILHNLKSSQAALRSILGQQETAISILNEVLSQNKQHWLSLFRRSQIYKKQNKLKKAFKDLQVLCMYAPDNMQVAALKLQLKALKSRNYGSSSQDESDLDDQQINQQQVLQFSNLKKIDRTSVSIMIPKGRQSRVSVGGDKAFFYQGQKCQRQSIIITPHYIRKKFIEIEDQIQQIEEQQIQQPLIFVKTAPSRNKSILKNRTSAIFVQKQQKNLISTEQGKRLIERLQNIQGQIISSEHGSYKQCSVKQVQFKKTSLTEDPESKDFQVIKKKPYSRKSCLKRSSFSVATEQPSKGKRRSSKFQNISRSSIDGKMIKSDKKKKRENTEAQKQNINRLSNESGDQSEEGSQYNIFGSKKLDINKQLRQNLGFRSDQIVETQDNLKQKTKKRGQSILKKTSILVKKQTNKTNKASIFFQDCNEQKPKDKKGKKSVMFRSC